MACRQQCLAYAGLHISRLYSKLFLFCDSVMKK
jgi:hypothetical protein